ncbi:transposase IS116/IS110/IS902 family protein [Allofrancisella inopinata]|nr:transposase IS116/IS110/IS902 family protein [Allofrancisella inopinata]
MGKKVELYNVKVKQLAKSQEPCQRLLDIEGIGELSGTAITAILGDPKNFRNGRHFAAFLGLIPRQSSSGQKTKLLGISKRGNTYLRTLLIHGARSVVANSTKSLWIQEKLRRSGYCKTLIAVANKNARVAWSILANKTKYDIDYNLNQVA